MTDVKEVEQKAAPVNVNDVRTVQEYVRRVTDLEVELTYARQSNDIIRQRALNRDIQAETVRVTNGLIQGNRDTVLASARDQVVRGTKRKLNERATMNNLIKLGATVTVAGVAVGLGMNLLDNVKKAGFNEGVASGIATSSAKSALSSKSLPNFVEYKGDLPTPMTGPFSDMDVVVSDYVTKSDLAQATVSKILTTSTGDSLVGPSIHARDLRKLFMQKFGGQADQIVAQHEKRVRKSQLAAAETAVDTVQAFAGLLKKLETVGVLFDPQTQMFIQTGIIVGNLLDFTKALENHLTTLPIQERLQVLQHLEKLDNANLELDLAQFLEQPIPRTLWNPSSWRGAFGQKYHDHLITKRLETLEKRFSKSPVVVNQGINIYPTRVRQEQELVDGGFTWSPSELTDAQLDTINRQLYTTRKYGESPTPIQKLSIALEILQPETETLRPVAQTPLTFGSTKVAFTRLFQSGYDAVTSLVGSEPTYQDTKASIAKKWVNYVSQHPDELIRRMQQTTPDARYFKAWVVTYLNLFEKNADVQQWIDFADITYDALHDSSQLVIMKDIHASQWIKKQYQDVTYLKL